MTTNYQVEAKQLWDSYIAEATKYLFVVPNLRWHTFQDLFVLTTPMLGEAIACYENELADAAVLICRAVLDTCILEYLQLEIMPAYDDKGHVVPFYTIRRDRITNKRGEYLHDWREIKEAVRKSDLYRGEDVESKLDEIYQVRDKGNFVAHIFKSSQVEADKAIRLLTIMTRVKDNVDISNIKKWGCTDEDIENARQMLQIDRQGRNVSYKRFTSIEEAKEVLKSTVDIILDIRSRFLKKQEREVAKAQDALSGKPTSQN